MLILLKNRPLIDFPSRSGITHHPVAAKVAAKNVAAKSVVAKNVAAKNVAAKNVAAKVSANLLP